jgi:hypothetical protein
VTLIRYEAAMVPLRILITNITLATRTGTETYVRDLAVGLLRRGHHPIVYSPELGEIAREMEAATVPVVNDLRHVGVAPDVIHGHHYAETLTALLHFSNTPAVGFCHDWGSFWDTPVRHPRVLRYVAVDDTCRDRLIARHGIAEGRVRVVLNAVDLQQFPMRGPLPTLPRLALVYSNMAREDNYLGVVRAACTAMGIKVDAIGQGVGDCREYPGKILGHYDLVFAKARCALEAMATGAAVILCDISGCGGLVTSENFDYLRRLNFGRRSLCETVSVETLVRHLGMYNAADAALVAGRVRREATLDAAIDELLQVYCEAIGEYRQAGASSAGQEGQAAAEGLRWLTPYIRDIHTQRGRLVAAVRERDELRIQHGQWRIQYDEVSTQRDQLLEAHELTVSDHATLLATHGSQAAEKACLRAENAALKAERDFLLTQMAAVQRSKAVRIAKRIRGLPLVPGLARFAARMARK